MPVEADLQELLATLADLAKGLGFAPGDLRESEEVATLVFGKPVEAEGLELIEPERLKRWFGRFGAALKIELEIPAELGASKGMSRSLTAKRHPQGILSDLSAESTKYGVPVEATVTITKGVLGKSLGLVDARNELRVLPFFFAERLQKILSETDFLSFEKDFLVDPVKGRICGRLLLLVADTGGQIRGPFLAIMGNDQLDQAKAFSRSGASLRRLSVAHELMSEECNWNGERPKALTPDFFILTTPGDLQGCRAELLRLQNELSLPYLADRTIKEQGKLEVIFEGTRAITILVEEERRSAAPYLLYRWAYRDLKSAATRLEIVRRVLSSGLHSGPGIFQTLVQRGPELVSECGVQLRVLIDQDLTESFERRERVDKMVREYADEIHKQIASLARELVNDAYKTAGLLLGVVIAFLLEPDQRPTVLILSAAALSSAYLFFVRLFYLPTLKQEQEARRHAFRKRETEIQRFGLLTEESKTALASVSVDDDLLTAQRTRVSQLYVAFAIVPLALLLVWLVVLVIGW
jgi:hypothetical protein